jgi:hypothetical protein
MLIAGVLAVTFGVGVVSATTTLTQKPKFNPFQAVEKVRTKDGLLNYKKENDGKLNNLKNQLAQEESVFVTITLTKTFNQNELEKFITDYNLKVQHVIARDIEKSTGLRGTSIMSPNKDGKISYDKLHEMINRNDAVFKGFIEIVADVPVAKLQSLETDKSVFLVDPSGDPHLVENPKKKYMHGVFWDLENKNMILEQ